MTLFNESKPAGGGRVNVTIRKIWFFYISIVTYDHNFLFDSSRFTLSQEKAFSHAKKSVTKILNYQKKMGW